MPCCSHASAGPCACRYQSSRLHGRAMQVRGGAGRAELQLPEASRAWGLVLPAAGLCDQGLFSASEPQRPPLGHCGLRGLLSEMPPRSFYKHDMPGPVRRRPPHGAGVCPESRAYTSRREVRWPGRPGERATLRRFRRSLQGRDSSRRSKGPGAGAGLACPRNKGVGMAGGKELGEAGSGAGRSGLEHKVRN